MYVLENFNVWQEVNSLILNISLSNSIALKGPFKLRLQSLKNNLLNKESVGGGIFRNTIKYQLHIKIDFMFCLLK